MRKNFLFFSLFLGGLVSFTSCTPSTRATDPKDQELAAEKKALEDLAAILENTNQKAREGLLDKKLEPGKGNSYKTLDNEGFVKAIYLNDDAIEDTLPSSLIQFKRLKRLELSNTDSDFLDLTPISSLKSLEFLDLSQNQDLALDNNTKNFSEVMKKLAKLTNLKSLNLSNCNLTGKITEEVWGLTNLISLNISMNSLTGSLSDKIQQLKNLRHLNLSNNKLTGSLPIEAFKKLTVLLPLKSNVFLMQNGTSFDNEADFKNETGFDIKASR